MNITRYIFFEIIIIPVIWFVWTAFLAGVRIYVWPFKEPKKEESEDRKIIIRIEYEKPKSNEIADSDDAEKSDKTSGIVDESHK